MRNGVSRRVVMCGVPAAVASSPGLLGLGAVLGSSAAAAGQAGQPGAGQGAVPHAWEGFPRQHPGLVMEIVGAAHRDEAKVRSLLDRYPGLVHGAWDWGFGDWETPLGAAAHTGRREIAELLLSRGARLDIFAATMLGLLDAVKGMIGAAPGVERALGPHCITLMAHARAGGERASAVAGFLSSLPGADAGPRVQAIDDAARALVAGEYEYGEAGSAVRFAVRAKEERLEFVAADGSGRRLHCLESGEFFPAGVPSVRFRFERDAATGRATGLAVVDHDLHVRARRVS